MAVTTASTSLTATTPVTTAATPAAGAAPAPGVAPAARAASTGGVAPAARAASAVAVPPALAVTATVVRERRRGRLRRAVLPLLLVAGLLAIDLARPPARQASARLLLGGIHLYQATLSARMAALGVQCRFRPTCSHYAAGAIARYGALSGSLRAAWRIVRCGPWTPLGTYDPP